MKSQNSFYRIVIAVIVLASGSIAVAGPAEKMVAGSLQKLPVSQGPQVVIDQTDLRFKQNDPNLYMHTGDPSTVVVLQQDALKHGKHGRIVMNSEGVQIFVPNDITEPHIQLNQYYHMKSELKAKTETPAVIGTEDLIPVKTSPSSGDGQLTPTNQNH